jgi:hypothetical protein
VKINPDIQSLARPIAWFKPDPRNARKHSPRNIKAIADSLRNFGQQKPVVALPDGTVVAGNGTLEAAKVLGLSSLACVVIEDEKAARAYAIADNRTAELAEWDPTGLEDALKDLMVMDMTPEEIGFDDVTLMTMGVRPHDRTVVTLNNEDAFGNIGKPREPFQQMTFVLSDAEAEHVKSVVHAAWARLPEQRENPNKNGAALALIISEWAAVNG